MVWYVCLSRRESIAIPHRFLDLELFWSPKNLNNSLKNQILGFHDCVAWRSLWTHVLLDSSEVRPRFLQPYQELLKVIRSVSSDPARFFFYQFSVIFDYHAGNTLELVTSNRSYRGQWVTKPGLSRRQRSHLEQTEQILSWTVTKKKKNETEWKN